MAQELSNEFEPGGICFEARAAIEGFVEAHNRRCSDFAYKYNLPESIDVGTEVEVAIYFELHDPKNIQPKARTLTMACMGTSAGNGIAFWKVAMQPIIVDLGFGEYLTCFESPHYNGPKVWYAPLPLQKNSKWSWLGCIDRVQGEEEIVYDSRGTPIHPEILWLEKESVGVG